MLTGQQREDLVARLKPMPGHKAKLTAFFTVIDEVSFTLVIVCVVRSSQDLLSLTRLKQVPQTREAKSSSVPPDKESR